VLDTCRVMNQEGFGEGESEPGDRLLKEIRAPAFQRIPLERPEQLDQPQPRRGGHGCRRTKRSCDAGFGKMQHVTNKKENAYY